MIFLNIVHKFRWYTLASIPGTPAIPDCYKKCDGNLKSALTDTPAVGTGSVLTTSFSVVIRPLDYTYLCGR